MEKQELFKLKQELIKKLNEVNNEISKLELDFDEWLIYNEKQDYSFITSLPDSLCNILEECCSVCRYETLTINTALSYINECCEDKDELLKIKNELMNANFGSVVWDW